MAGEETKQPKKSFSVGPYQDFQQQTCYPCISVTRPVPLGCCFLLIALLSAIVGIIFIISSTYAHETDTFRYDNLCEIDTRCTFRFEIEEDLEAPVYLYYRLDNMYQGYRRYYKSRADYQLMDVVEANNYDRLDGCEPKISKDDDDAPHNVYLPCGLQAWSFFNDTFTLMKDNGKPVKQSSKNIELPHDSRVFSDPGPSTEGIRLVDSFENPHFMVWMQPGAHPSFYKLYAIIDEDLDKGLYKMEVDNRYDVTGFDGTKAFRLSTVTWIGGRVFYVGGALLILCAVMLVAGVFICLKSCFWPRKLGNIAYLDWD